MKIKTLFLMTFLSSTAFAAGEYDFDYDNRNDMRGAWFVCGFTAFTEGDCPEVFEKCWQPPMIYLRCNRHGCSTRSYCTNPPSFTMSNRDVQRANQNAASMNQ